MQNMVWKLLLIVAVIGLCVLSVLTRNLSLGPDLRGGTSLVYQVTMSDEGNPQEVLTQVITALKDRVNPRGVLAISMEPLGRDRIEIVMPLPNAEVQELGRQYRDALEALVKQSEIRSSELDAAVASGDACAALGIAPDSARGVEIKILEAAQAALQTARRNLENRDPGLEGAPLRALQAQVANAEIAYEDARSDVLAMSLTEARVRRTLNASTEPQRVRNDDGTSKLDEDGNPIFGESLREKALASLRADFADVAPALDAAVAAYDAYQAKRTGFDDPEDLMRLLRGAGVLEFHIAVTTTQPDGVNIDDLRAQLDEFGPEGTTSSIARWFPLNKLDGWYDSAAELVALERDPQGYFASRYGLVAGEADGQIYLLLFTGLDKSMTHGAGREWSVTDSSRTIDNLGRAAVSFGTDAPGSSLMGRLTGSNIGRPMAIVLDGEVYSAPNIRSTISGQGQITGTFTDEEITYLVRVLNAGSLSARLSENPIAVNTLGPSLGRDNLRRGREGFAIALVAVAAFMILYYFLAGVVAVFALAANGVIIFGVMMGMDSTFTLPGLAGIILTIGMAVDANVLIYERIREEIFAGESDLRACVREGYGKALSTILDGNITNLIVCLVLFKTATTEVKGFAVTLTIGILGTLFTALFVTRQFYYFYTDLFKARKLPMLPTVVPAIHRFLEPNINWVGLRKIFWAISGTAVIISVFLVWNRGVDMFDTELRGGVSLTMETKQTGVDAEGDPVRIMLRQSGSADAVQDRIKQIGDDAAAKLASASGAEETARLTVLREFQNAAVLTSGSVGADAEGNAESDAFQIKIANPKGLGDTETIVRSVVSAIVDEFGDLLDVTEPLDFKGADETDSTAYVAPITHERLGDNEGMPASARQNVKDFMGGAAIHLQDVTPPASVEEVERRLDRMRNQPDFARFSGREVAVFGLAEAVAGDPAQGYTEFAVVVFDEFRNFRKVEPDLWFSDMAEAEWQLVNTALRQPPSLKQVSTYSSAVAATLSAQAVVAVVLTLLGILVYIWVRFGSLRYSIAAIVALVHDVCLSLGLLALSAIIGATALGHALLVEPFRIDLGVVAALLTIIGYSLNDTIVILDRIRENRGKRPLPTAKIVNRSINQTVSRTLLTSTTTLIAVIIMYLEGGSGIRPFTFCLLAGLIVGTYSSVGIAAPLVIGRGGAKATGEGEITSRPGDEGVVAA